MAVTFDYRNLFDVTTDFLAGRGLTAQAATLAEIESIRVTGVRLHDSGGVERAWGLSRSDRASSRAVATAEAVEHLVAVGATPDLYAGDVELDATAAGTRGESVHGDRLMSWIRDRGRGERLLCREYRLFAGVGPDRATVPRFLVDLSYWRTADIPASLRSFVRYGSSTGWSVGVTAEEAISRGLVELIERDALSRFMSAIYLGSRYPCGYVDLGNAPDHVRELADAARRWLGLPISVLALEERAGLHVCLASTPDRTLVKRTIGKGADVDPWQACVRAIGELCQIYAVHRAGWLEYDDAGHLRRFERIAPRLRQVYDLRICPGELNFARGAAEFGSGRSIDRATWHRELTASMRRPCYRWVAELVAGSLYAASVYLPGAERFFLAEHGVEIAPTGDNPLAPALPL